MDEQEVQSNSRQKNLICLIYKSIRSTYAIGLIFSSFSLICAQIFKTNIMQTKISDGTIVIEFLSKLAVIIALPSLHIKKKLARWAALFYFMSVTSD